MKRQIPLWFTAFVFILLSVGLTYAVAVTPPTIISFSPFSGPIGTSVTITGTNFSATANQNIVFFGATKATVTAASTTSLTVTVPTGATYQPITVLNLTTAFMASSKAPFEVTFTGGAIATNSLDPKVDLATGTYPVSVSIGDLDGDGKADLVVASQNSNNISVFRNIASSGSIASSSFAAKVDFTTGVNPYSVSIGDLDGDGKPDLVVANKGSNTISVFRNTATSGSSITSSSFAAKVDFTTGGAPFSVSIGDLDGNGKADLVVSNSNNANISVFRNTATSGSITISSFAAKVDFTTGTTPSTVRIGDLDGDGKADLVVANSGSNNISVFRNTATSGSITSSSFASKVDFTTGSFPASVSIGDLDGDDQADLVVSNYISNTVSVFRNTATSGSITSTSFAGKVDFAMGTGTKPFSVSIGDLDGDGKADWVVSLRGTDKISVFRNIATSGSITSSSFDNKMDFTTGDDPFFVNIGDLDGDGKADLVVANLLSNTISVFRNNPKPPTITSVSPASGIVGTSVTITGTSFNATADQNIVFFGATKATVTAASTTSLTVTVPTGATYQPITVLNLTTALMVSSKAPFRVTFTGGAIAANSLDPKVDFATGAAPAAVSIGDLDGDGKADLVVANGGSNTISVFRNTALSGSSITSSSFSAKVDFTTDADPFSVNIGDLDGDGKLDLVVANNGGATISVFRNTATSGSITSGSLAAKVDFTTGSGPVSVNIGDLDGDGKADLVVANQNSATISVFRNTATSGSITSGSFTAKVDFATGTQPASVSIGDLDGDGKADLVVANENSATISVFRNTATSGSITNSSFAGKVDFTTGSVPLSVSIGDLDGDGQADLVVGNSNSNNISVYRSKATSGSITSTSFEGKVDLATGETPRSVSIGDLDGDGKADLVVANYNSNTISVIRNTATSGSISFAANVDFSPGATPVSVSIGDLDGDGKPDLVVANAFSNTISVFRNNPPPPIAAPIITPPGSLSVCSPSTLTLTASGCAGTVTWSQGAVTGTSLTLSAVGTYSITATCTDAGTTSAASTAVTGLEIKAKPNAPSITPPAILSVFTPSTLTLTASGCAGTVTWSEGAATGTSLTLSTVGTYSITATCTVNGCISDASSAVTGLEIKAIPSSSPPTITSFSPTSGIIGTSVTITGTNFNATANQNMVFFGATQATVTAASTTSLTVTVPSGATYQPITVLNLATTLMANSKAPFQVTFTGGAIAANSLDPKVDFSTGATPVGVSIGDLDGDGKADLVVANQSSGTISVFRNTAPSGSIISSSFAGKVDFATGLNPFFVSIGDLDGDGKADLVVANQNNATISVFRNTASSGSITSGSFAAKEDFITGTSPSSVSIGDLDGDGKADLVVANQGSATISVFRNTATSGSITSGSFAAKVDFITGTYPTSVRIGDLDGDGKADLVVSNNGSNTISVFRNTATSGSITSTSFADKVDFTTGAAPVFVSIGDLDGDGKADLVVANINSFTISVFRNTATSGSISFADKMDFTTGFYPFFVNIGDLDGDGKPDLVVANLLSNTISVFRNNPKIPQGSLSANGPFCTSGTGQLTFTATEGTGPFTVVYNDGTANRTATNVVSGTAFNVVTNPVSTTTTYTLVSVTYANSVVRTSEFTVGSATIIINPAVVVPTPQANTQIPLGGSVTLTATGCSGVNDVLKWYQSLDNALVNMPVSPTTTKNYYAKCESILNGITCTSGKSTDVTVALSLSPPTITSFLPASGVVGTTVTLTGTNFNATANQNIVFFGATRATVTASTATSVTVTVPTGATYAPITLLNTGTSLAAYSLSNFTPTYSPAKTTITATDFQTKQDFTAGDNPSLVAMGDLDGDGKPDLVVANSISNSVSVFRNTSNDGSIGSGSFADKVDFATGSYPISVAIGDLDGDGKPDLAVANNGSDEVSVIRNTSSVGRINFDARVNFATGSRSYPISVAIGDLDGDGKPDLAVANVSSGEISVIRNTSSVGSIDFDASVDFTTGFESSPISVAIGDLDGDGKPDLAVANNGSDEVSVIRNTSSVGSIVFADKVDFATGSFPISVAIGDLDGDGKPDLAVANSEAEAVSVIRNTSSVGSITFADKVDFATGISPNSVAIGDLDGDGKPDLAVANLYSEAVSVIRNTSSVGSIVFADKVDFAIGLYPSSVAIGDLDGDGKPDLAVVNSGSNSVSVLRNANTNDTNTDLSSLTLSVGTLSPTFAAATTTYTVSVANATTGITLTPTLADANASVTVNGTTVVNGTASDNIALNEGSNTITVVVTAQNATTKTYTITVLRSILPTFSAVAPICSGATLSALPTTSNNNIVGTWSPILDNLNTTTYTFSPTAGQNASSTTLIVTVNASPTATASSNSPLCAGTTINLSASATSRGETSYAWTGPNSFSSTDQNPSVASATTTASGTYQLIVTNAEGCTAIATTSVMVNPVVVIPTPQANTQSIFGGSVTLTATGCSGVNDVLKWYQSADNTLVTMPVSPLATTNYYAKCESTLNGITCLSANSIEVTVTVISRIYVDITKIAAPLQDGNSWATAFGSLQAGLAAATLGRDVWVAKGTYKPTTTTTRSIYFNMPNNIAVYGGFAGTEDNLSQRDLRTNVSILSGDIGTQNVAIDNTYHVVVMDGSSTNTILDGFTITGGNANFDPKINGYPSVSSPAQSELSIETGGGILVLNAGKPVITHCKIIANNAIFGGGIFCIDGSTFTMYESTISNNESTFGSAIYAQNASHFTMNNVLIVANRGLGCVYNDHSNPTLTNCTIASNGGYNGGIFNSASQPVVKNSILWGNAEPFAISDNQSIISYSIVQGGYSGTGNLNVDPQLVNPAPFQPAPNTTGDYHLQATSLAIDRGDNGAISLTDKDLDGNLRRFSRGKVDMGAYEFQGIGTSTLVISVVTGPWEANSTWDIGRVPKLGDNVIIDNSHIVTLSTSGIAKNLQYRGTGTLKFNSATSKLELGF